MSLVRFAIRLDRSQHSFTRQQPVEAERSRLISQGAGQDFAVGRMPE